SSSVPMTFTPSASFHRCNPGFIFTPHFRSHSPRELERRRCHLSHSGTASWGATKLIMARVQLLQTRLDLLRCANGLDVVDIDAKRWLDGVICTLVPRA